MPDNTGGEQDPVTPSGRFLPGQSGNPQGRKAGSRNTATVALDELLANEGERITRKAIEMAAGGDQVALRLVLERILPVRRGRPIKFDMPEIKTAADIVSGIGGVLRAASSGELTPDEAATIAGIFEVKRRAIEMVEMEGRLAALEKRVGEPGQ